LAKISETLERRLIAQSDRHIDIRVALIVSSRD
jgi:hypothetical protein